jgi:selenocysteine-specific elongation factor
VEVASPGRRLAINLSGISPDELKRGDVVAAPNTITPTELVDVRLRWLDDAPQPLTHNMELEFFSGSFQTLARTRLLGEDELKAGQEGWAQLALAHPAALLKHDRFIVRQPSPSLTVGGGLIVDAHPSQRHRRFKPEVVERLTRLMRGSPADILLEALLRLEPIARDELLQQSNLTRDAAAVALRELLANGQALQLDESILMSASGWRASLDKMCATLSMYHAQYPLRAGMAREELKSRLGLSARVFDMVIARAARENLIVDTATVVRLATHQVTFTPVQTTRIQQLLTTLAKNKYAPPSYDECAAVVGADVLNALIEQGRIVKLNESVVYGVEAYQEMVERIKAHLRQHGTITVAQVRDMFNASRKYALGLMEHLDDIKLTRRVGDERVLR